MKTETMFTAPAQVEHLSLSTGGAPALHKFLTSGPGVIRYPWLNTNVAEKVNEKEQNDDIHNLNKKKKKTLLFWLC